MTLRTTLCGASPASLPSAQVAPSARRAMWPFLLLVSLLWGCGGNKEVAPLAPQAIAPPVRTVFSNPPPESVPVRNMAQASAPHTTTASRPILPPVQVAPEPVQVVPMPGRSQSFGPSAANQRGESPEELALQQAEQLHVQAKWAEAWRSWAAIANGSAFPSANPFYTDKAWQRLLETYFFLANADNTPFFLQAIADFEPTASQHRILQDLISQQPKERGKYLLSLQPPASLLAAALRNQQEGAFAPQESQAPPALALSTAIAQPGIPVPIAPPSAGTARKVGLLLPLSGKWASMGEHLRRAAKKALADYPTTPIQLQIADSGDGPESSQKGVQELVGQQVDVIIGPVFYATVQPAIETALANQTPIITLNPQREGDALPKGAFSNAFQPEQQAKIMAKHAVVEKKFTRIAILAPESEYGRGVSKTFTDEVHALGGAIVRSAYFAQDANDFSPWLKALGNQFDALFLPASAKQVRLIAPQVAAFRTGVGTGAGAGMKKITLLGTSLWQSPELLAEGGEYLEGAVFCDVDNNAKEQFRQSFRQTWEEDPTSWATLAYDSVAMIAQILQEGGVQGGKIAPSAIARPNGFRGANGALRFLENGLSRRVYHLFQVEGGQVRQVQVVRDSLTIP
ncbi:MAG: penicillin-binding protein activator [Magnetococcales bacterium]|nr:penicillin-binding protein activator [Magnetococcales bacterium]MBF0116577.1 penicillin-binding protein activator [Magnetococcales bacterium]